MPLSKKHIQAVYGAVAFDRRTDAWKLNPGAATSRAPVFGSEKVEGSKPLHQLVDLHQGRPKR